ncbi:MAG: hypothetical protein HY000_30945 [Planctomycetes bacterium]|nr:hypothetical protein [Planctomycetota bacterium]
MSADQVPSGASATTIPTSQAGGLRAGLPLGIVLALIGGGLSWGLIQRFDPVFLVPEEFHIQELGASEERHMRLSAEQSKVDRVNATIDLALLGALLAGSLGLAETISRRSVVPVLMALPVGAIFGGLSGLCGFAAFQLCNTGGLLAAVESAAKVQAAMLAVLGAGVGLAVGLSTFSLRTAATTTVAGAVGGGFAGLVYPVVASFVFPVVGTERLIPRGGDNRLLWIELAAALLALMVIGVGRGKAKACG